MIEIPNEAFLVPASEATRMALAQTARAFETVVDYSVQFDDSPRWYKTDLSCQEATKMLSSGTIDGKHIAAVQVSTTATPDGNGQVHMIYDFIQAKRGLPAWRLSHEPV